MNPSVTLKPLNIKLQSSRSTRTSPSSLDLKKHQAFTVPTSLIPHGRPQINTNYDQSIFLLINHRYKLGKKIGYGSFGEVFQGLDIQTQKPVAIKIEHIDSEHQILQHEYQVYQELLCNRNNTGQLVHIHYYGIEDDYNVLVMDSLGPTLSDLLQLCRGTFSLKTTLMLADQMLSRLEFMHDRDFIHRDLKPENFLIGSGNSNNQVYLIDYGLAKRYRLNGKHLSYKTGHKLVGTARYASTNSHLGIRLSRRDDVESLGYIIIYFLRGSLPWQSLKAGTKEEKYQNILKLKATITLDQLCSEVPIEIRQFMEHVRSLEFIERPNYKYLRGLLAGAMKRHHFIYDLVFDWTRTK